MNYEKLARWTKLGLAGWVLVCAAGLTRAADPAEPAQGLSAVHVGNSHSHPLRLLTPLTALIGHANYKPGDVNILGSPLSWNWSHGEQNKWPQTLAATNKWDAITLLSWAGDDAEFACKFAGEAYKGNPQCQVYIYVIWPDSNMSFETPADVRTEAHGEKVADAVAAAFPNAPKPRVIPTSLLIRELGRLADRGELPGVENRFALFCDGGHLSQFGQYAINVTICAMLYGESPLNYPVDIYAKDNAGRPIRGMYQSVTVPEETGAIIKRTAWDILQTYPPSGTKPGLAIANRRLDAAIAGQPYKAELKALNATAPCTWSLAQGTLPKGLALSAAGAIEGTPSEASRTPIVVRMATGKDTVERPLVLEVNQDTPPAIPAQPVASVSLDTYVFLPLKFSGGVGALNWTLSNGELPYGIMLSPAGMLVGTPGEEGDFTFKIKVADSHPAGPREAEREFSWKITAAKPETLQIGYVITQGYDFPLVKAANHEDDSMKIAKDAFPKVDGKLDEPFWRFDQPIAKAVEGKPSKKAAFSAVWTGGCSGNTLPGRPVPPGTLYMGDTPGRVWSLQGSDLVLAIKVLDGPAGKTPKDGIHVYLDARHDGKVIYGADDSHFFIPRDFKKNGEWAPMVRGLKAPWFSKLVVQEIEGGYVAEVSFGPANFCGDGQWLAFGARAVYGFDIAVDEGTDGNVSRQVWRGDANDAEDTSHLGTIVLAAQPVAK